MLIYRLMDNLWKKAGLEMMMVHYDIVATSVENGLIEVREYPSVH
jgi:hypothetical protein